MYLLLKGQTNPFINQPMGNGCATFSKRLMAWFIFSHLNSGRPSQCFNILEEYQMNYYVNLFGGIYMYIYIYIPWNSKTMKKARCNWITGVCNQNPGFPENHGFPFPAGPQLMPFWPVPRGKDLCQTSSEPSGVKLWCSNGEFPKPKVTN